MKLSLLKATVGKAAGGVRIEIQNDGGVPRRNLVIKAECYDKKGILKDEVKARRAELIPGEIWIVKSRSKWFRYWSIVELSVVDE